MKKKIFFKAGKNRLCGVLHLPKKKFNNIVLMLHGFTGTKDEKHMKYVANNFEKNGFAVFRFDFFAHNESSGSFNELSVKEEVIETKKAIKLLKNLDYKNIFIIGHSLGGLVALKVAHLVKAVVLWAPSIFFKETFKHIVGKDKVKELMIKGFTNLEPKYWGYNWKDYYTSFKFTKKFWLERKNINLKFLHNIKTPVRIIHGSKDNIVFLKYSKKLYTILKCRKDLKKIKNADHDFIGCYDKLFELSYSWIKKHVS